MIRSAAGLMPIFSLPGPFGHGVFGGEALDFAGRLREAGFSNWLILPLSPPDEWHSPYQCCSSFAGNPAFIDPRELCREGLLMPEEVEALYLPEEHRIPYDAYLSQHQAAMEKAYRRLPPEKQLKVKDYASREEKWLKDYAVFMAARKISGNKPWWQWEDEGLKRKDPGRVERFIQEAADLIHFYEFEQYEFEREWDALKQQINQIGIRIIGDLPIYPAPDSADFWGQREIFECNDEGLPSRVGGVPPDSFSEEGQLWGSPLYRWDVLKNRDYDYWIQRISRQLYLYDLLRLDHFIGFHNYWAIPADADSARLGKWEKGPGIDLFQTILHKFPADAFIAEDLGVINAEVRQFLRDTGIPGMKVLQCAFNDDENDKDRPHDWYRHCVAFTGTHDNDTLLNWARSLNEEAWERIRGYFMLSPDARAEEGSQNELCRRVILTLWQSVAELVVVPVSDLLGKAENYRINEPGTLGDNWTLRYTQEELDAMDIEWLKEISRYCQRI